MKKLTDNLYIGSDQYQYILYEKKQIKKGEKAGKDNYDPVGFFSTPEQVSKKLCDIGVKQFIDKDWIDCVRFVDESHENFKKYLYDRENNG
jgi:hypothetical protein